jgi:hypothetical protein
MYIHIYNRIWNDIIYTYIHISAYMHIIIGSEMTSLRARALVKRWHKHYIYLCMYAFKKYLLFVCKFVYVYIYISIYIYVYINMLKYVFIYIHIYMYICIYTCIYIYIYTYVYKCIQYMCIRGWICFFLRNICTYMYTIRIKTPYILLSFFVFITYA